MIVRTACDRDIPALLTLERAAFGAAAWGEAAVRAELTGVPETRYLIVAEGRGTVLGYAALMVVGGTGDVLRVAVAPGRRRLGIGRRLTSELMAQARRRGCATVLLEVGADNEAARELYVGMGFAVVADRLDYYGAGRDALVMSRSLLAGSGD